MKNPFDTILQRFPASLCSTTVHRRAMSDKIAWLAGPGPASNYKILPNSRNQIS